MMARDFFLQVSYEEPGSLCWRETVHIKGSSGPSVAGQRRNGKGTYSVYTCAQSARKKLCSAAAGQHQYLFVSCLVPGRSRWRLA